MQHTTHQRNRSPVFPTLFLVLFLAATVAAGETRHSVAFSEDGFESGWQATLYQSHTMANYFLTRIDDISVLRNYPTFNLNGAKTLFEGGCDQCSDGLDNADIAWVSTHGGAWTNRATWVMYNQNTRAFSDEMRLGNEADQLRILASYACAQLDHNEPDFNELIDRWDSVMRGGLQVALGSHGSLYFSTASTYKYVGRDFAQELKDGTTIRYAWYYGLDVNTNKQDIAALFTGTSSSNCSSRRSGMTWSNIESYSVLRDGSVDYYCTSRWTDK